MPTLVAPANASKTSSHTALPFDLLDACHKDVAAVLRQLSDLLEHLQQKGTDEEARELARHVFNFFMTTARQHHEDEEKHIFPALLRSDNDNLVRQTLRLQQDHGWIEEDWLALAPQIESIAAGYNWFNIEQLELTIPVFIALYQDHLVLEESLIYPEAKARMSSWELKGMGREMAERRRHKQP